MIVQDESNQDMAQFIPNDRPIHLLDVGCCTKLEYRSFFRTNHSLEITGVLEEQKMVSFLKARGNRRIEGLHLIYENCLQADFGGHQYDVAITSVKLSETTRKTRMELYRKIYSCLLETGYLLVKCCTEGRQEDLNCWTSISSDEISVLLECGFKSIEKLECTKEVIIFKANK